jgi:hypothetical protein
MDILKFHAHQYPIECEKCGSKNLSFRSLFFCSQRILMLEGRCLDCSEEQERCIDIEFCIAQCFRMDDAKGRYVEGNETVN